MASGDILNVPCEEYASSLRQSFWFYNECPYFTLGARLKVSPKFRKFKRYSPGIRKEVILLRKVIFHCHQIKPQQVLPRQHLDPWVMVDLLVEVHFDESIRMDLSVGPPQIPIAASLFTLDHPAQFLRYFLNNRILGVADVNDNLLALKAIG